MQSIENPNILSYVNYKGVQQWELILMQERHKMPASPTL